MSKREQLRKDKGGKDLRQISLIYKFFISFNKKDISILCVSQNDEKLNNILKKKKWKYNTRVPDPFYSNEMIFCRIELEQNYVQF